MKCLLLQLFAAAGLLLSGTFAVVNVPTSEQIRQEKDYFLPTHVVPEHYNLSFEPNFEDKDPPPTFTGSSRMTFRVTESGTQSVSFHVGNSLALSYSSIKVAAEDGTPLTILDREYDKVTEIFTLTLADELHPELKYVLSADFVGPITEAGFGMFRGSYLDKNATRYYVGTQLRPVSARKLFPCLDEPKYKAQFTVHISRPADYLSRSNMNIVQTSEINENGRLTDTYEVTPVMSTFLVTVFVFDFASETSKQDQRFIGWAEPSKIKQMEWSQEISPDLVDIAEDYFQSVLPVPKMDQIALPQFGVIAMENWGINTYKEINVLAGDESALRQFQTVGRFTGHEVLHHWIGDLVTLEWWDWLWMHEAFAMYFEYFLPNRLNPATKMMEQFITDLNVEGLHTDNLNSPLTSHVVTQEEIGSKFIGLTYTKGPALIRMLNHAMGEENFRDALRALVEQKKYSTINPTELWSFFQSTAPPEADIARMMPTWTDQGSYPILIAVRDISHPNLIHLCQHSFEKFKSIDSVDDDLLLWSVPLTFTVKSERNFLDTRTKRWLNTKKDEFHLENYDPSTDWFIFNIQFVGYFRVLYDEFNLEMLINQLKADHQAIHPLNRAQLIDDTFSFAEVGNLNYPKALDLLLYMPLESEYVPWRVALRAINQLHSRLILSVQNQRFSAFVQDLLLNIYKKTGFEIIFSDEPIDRLNREQIIESACYFNVRDCRAEAVRYLDQHITTREIIPQDVQATVRCYGAKEGTDEMRNFLYDIMKTSPDLLKVAEAKSALACSPPPYLKKILEELPDAKWKEFFAAIVAREENAFFAMKFVMMNFDSLFVRFGADGMKQFLKQLEKKKSLFGMQNEVYSDLENVNPAHKNKVQPAIASFFESLESNMDWITIRTPEIEMWLNENYGQRPISRRFIHLTRRCTMPGC